MVSKKNQGKTPPEYGVHAVLGDLDAPAEPLVPTWLLEQLEAKELEPDRLLRKKVARNRAEAEARVKFGRLKDLRGCRLAWMTPRQIRMAMERALGAAAYEGRRHFEDLDFDVPKPRAAVPTTSRKPNADLFNDGRKDPNGSLWKSAGEGPEMNREPSVSTGAALPAHLQRFVL